MDIDKFSQAKKIQGELSHLDSIISRLESIDGAHALALVGYDMSHLPDALAMQIRGLALDHFQAEKRNLRDAFGAL